MLTSLPDADFLHRILESSPFGVWVADEQGRVVFANHRLAELLGTCVQAMLGYPLQPFVAEGGRAIGPDYWRETAPGQLELRLVRADGHAFDALLATAPLRGPDGQATGAVGLVVDVSARAALTRILQARERQLSAAEHFAQMGSWTWDIGSGRVQWSDELYRIYGLEPQSVPITFEEYLRRVHPDDRDNCARQVQAALESGAPFAYDERIVWPDGTIRHLVSRGELTCDASGRPDGAIGICMDVTARRLSEEQLDFLARFDPVTALPNRFSLLARAERLLARAQPRAIAGFLLIDLDHFRAFNDSLGHHTGDALLAEVGKRLLDSVRPGDLLGRIGGDEFLVVLEGLAGPADATIAAGKLLAALAGPITVDDEVFRVNASIGIACAPGDGDDVHALLKHADAALYRAKQAGRGTWCLYSEALGERAEEVHRLTRHLDGAIGRGELSLVYQPCVAVADGRVTRAEALLRWVHPELGAVSPARFVPLAEDTGQIVEIGRWVLETACRQMRALRDRGLPLQVAVNVSARQLLDGTFAQDVRDILAETGCRAEDLEFEITESTTVHDYPAVNAMMAVLGELGVSFAIDDFGTGYSSLAQLRRLRIDRLKVDRSFVEGVDADGTPHAIVAAIVAMTRALGLRTVAEGVETASQFAALAGLGCDEVQGYYFARPMDAGALADFLARGPGSPSPR